MMHRPTVLLAVSLFAIGSMGSSSHADDPPPLDAGMEGKLRPEARRDAGPSPVGEQARTAINGLIQLQAERRRYVEVYGPGHPKVVELDQEIERVQKVINETPDRGADSTEAAVERFDSVAPTQSPIDVQRLNHAELSDLIEQMLRRIDSLEKEVATLKQRPVMLEPLNDPASSP